MGIPRGITLIVGGGFHGKTTLLEALQWGIYNKVPGDGREFVVVEPVAVKIRAEDGRSVTSVDASGSTSQAANIMEALELGATTLLVDEDTCATNFMIRDKRMQTLVSKDKEPITPFVHKIRPLWQQHGVGTIMVVGGSGDFFDVADNVIMMDCYQAVCVTQQAKEISRMFQAENGFTKVKTSRDQDASESFGSIVHRVISEGCLSPNGKVKAVGTRTISYGYNEIDLSCVEQLAEASQTRAISRCLQRLAESTGDQILNGRRTLPDVLAAAWSIIASSSASGTGHNGLDALSPFADPTGDLSLPRKIEIGFAINRFRKLRVNSMVSKEAQRNAENY